MSIKDGPAPVPGAPARLGAALAAETPSVALDDTLFFTYQPIVSAHSGQCYGYEAVAQGFERIGFPSLAALADHAFALGRLDRLEAGLREKAVRDFVRFAGRGEKLLLSLDSRGLAEAPEAPRRTAEVLARVGLNPTALCLCLSEFQAGAGSGTVGPGLEAWRRQSYLLALDRFGAGTAGLRTLYDHQPNLIKIDRLFTAGIHADERKKLFLATVVNLAHVLGITVIAEGITGEEEFRTCKQIGCDLIQGGFVGGPATIATAASRSCSVIAETNRRERRERRGDQRLLREELTLLPALHIRDPMAKVYQAFRAQKEHGFLPIVDDRHQPLGLIREIDLRDVIYSRYGKDLLHNKALHRGLLDFLRPCPVCDINTEAERILEIFSQAVDPPGIVLVDDFEYVGVLSAASLLRVVNEKNLALARDQNPLTRLPGNSSINDHITAALETAGSSWIFAYFDLDNFKPFNDRFGFRQGDRA
ncbi:MAG: GGDEF domain-containing protein, partial [Rhodospirillaceae bacterium]